MEISQFERDVFQKSMVILLNRPSLEFIGILSYGIKIRICAKEEYAGKTKIPSLAFTDGEFIVLMAQDDITPKQLAFIVSHEVWHVLN